MSFAVVVPKREFYSVFFKGLDLETQKWIDGVGYCEGWNIEDCAGQALVEKYWPDGSIWWQNNAKFIGNISVTGIKKD